ncbi:NAD-dependent epimerase/dehydratase family protein [Thauera aromatica]|uniref:NAD-dependent epimerase/dehydratase family protein n=1 Tax=Thauera aromatica TaxID=59405 RepID=UPI001FFD590E|nr:NAD-dependent epimerase/dehydratase family protein [Thauera aromatica]MCK2086761.1 NAD-dependent epimerase/dehydratase family protein [Thauera aromatica]
MTSALIGYTGFVGGNIARQASFDACFNSKNVDEIRGKGFDLVVCAGVPAVKWWANKNPAEDWAIIERLIDIYSTVKARRFVLISTVDVYPHPAGVDERTSIELEGLHPYGRHRLLLEKALEGKFEELHVVRLPALFGPGLKKNALYDFLCSNQTEKINLASCFQWYPLTRIWADIQKVIERRLSLVNFAVEPLPMRVIKERFFPGIAAGTAPAPVAFYDMQSVHAQAFGEADERYLMRAPEVLDEMARWLKSPEVHCA